MAFKIFQKNVSNEDIRYATLLLAYYDVDEWGD